MTKEVFTQEFKKCFTIYQQVELIKEYIKDLDIPVDYLPLKTLSYDITQENLAQVFIDNDIESALLNGRYVVGRVYTPAGPTSNESYYYYMFDLSTGFRYLISKVIAGTTIRYSNERITYLTSSADAGNVTGELKWNRRQEYDADLSFEITMTDVDNNNTISGELLIGNYATYMTNNYWTIGMDNDILTIASDVESGMGIRGGTTNDTTYMKMYAGDNKLSIDSEKGLSINGQPFKVKYKHTIGVRFYGSSSTTGEPLSIGSSIILTFINDNPNIMNIQEICDYYNNFNLPTFKTSEFEAKSTDNLNFSCKLYCDYYGNKAWRLTYINLGFNDDVVTYTDSSLSLGSTIQPHINTADIGIDVSNQDIVEPILVSNI